MSDRPSREARFSARVGVRRLDGCEPWLGQVSARTGGGLFFDDDNRQRSAQVVRWELVHGRLPPRTSVTQRCGLPTCVRLEHLRVGRAARQPRTAVAAPPTCAARGLCEALEQSRRTRREAEQLRLGAQDVLVRARSVMDTALRLTRGVGGRPGQPFP